MTTDPTYQRLLETSWRRPLTTAEENELRAWLVEHPECAVEWEVEAGLNHGLGVLRDVPVPSNFTARVIAAVEREQTTESRRTAAWLPVWRGLSRWLPRTAVAGVILGVGAIAYIHTSQNARREDLARSVETVCDVRSMPSPRILEDFDAIQELTPAPKPDVALLSLLE
jgi:hypothetical protein